MKRSSYDSVAADGIGFPVVLTFVALGALTASSSVAKDSYQDRPASRANVLDEGKRGQALRLASMHVHLTDVGTGTGQTTLKLYRNGAAIPGAVATLTVTAAATDVTIDLRTNELVGPAIQSGDTLDLRVMEVPGTTAPAGAVVKVTAQGFGVEG